MKLAPISRRRAGLLVLGGAVALSGGAVIACGGAESRGPSTDPSHPGQSVTDILGGIDVTSASLDAIGTVGIAYDDNGYGDAGAPGQNYQPSCTGTLIGPTAVITAKHCVEYYAGGAPFTDSADMYFTIGSDANSPLRRIRVADSETAPNDVGGFAGFGSDVAILHLSEPVLGTKVLGIETLSDADVGKRLSIVGFGSQDGYGYGYGGGTRKAGNVTVRALTGRVYELMFGGFDAYRDYVNSNGYPTYPSSDAGVILNFDAGQTTFFSDGGAWAYEPGDTGTISISIDGGVADSDAGSPVDEGDGGRPDFDGGPEGGPDAWIRATYDNTLLLEGYEAYVGNAAGDAQPCGIDLGGPLIGRTSAGLAVAGVASGTIRGKKSACDYGAVYGTFGPSTLAFIEHALTWVDPCNGISTSGQCQGTVATRCTGRNVGARRLTTTDCSLLDMQCAYDAAGAATCTDGALPPPGANPGARLAVDAMRAHVARTSLK